VHLSADTAVFKADARCEDVDAFFLMPMVMVY
jgi:hypothetical protein